MKYPSEKEVKTFVEKLWRDDLYDHSIDVNRLGNEYHIKVRQMYNYVPLDFARLLELSQFFDTKNINDSRYHTNGCETCDYGSSYEITLYVKEEGDDNE